MTAGRVLLTKGRMRGHSWPHLGRVVDNIRNAQLESLLLTLPLFSNLSLPWPPVYCARDKAVPQVPSWVISLLLAGFTLEAGITDGHSSVLFWSVFS